MLRSVASKVSSSSSRITPVGKPGALSYRVGGRLSSVAGRRGGEGDEASWEYDHDVLVVGGGIVGCSLACRLAQDARISSSRDVTEAGKPHAEQAMKRPSVGLIEARPPPPLARALARENPDPRVYSLTPSSVGLLKAVGVWEAGGLEERSQPFRGMQVWDDRGPGHLRFDDEEGGEPLGFISEHGVIHSALFERVRELEAEGLTEVTCPAQVKGVKFPSAGPGGATGPLQVTVETDGGETSVVSCRLLVAADGGDSKVAKMLGLSSWGWGYGQRAVVATVRLAGFHDETAFQRYLSGGPLAMLPLKDGLASLVWSTTPAHAELLKSMTEAEFLTEVNNAMRLPSTPSVGGPAFCGSETSPQFSSNRSSERAPFSAEASGLGASALAALAGGEGPPEGKIPSIFGGVSSLVAPPVAAVNAVAEGLVKGAEGVAGALAGLSLGLEGAEGSTGGFSMPPEAVEVMTPRLGFDLSLRQAHSYTAARAALVGDAAHTVHPMAGQGLNLGIADADALARVVLEGRRSGTDLGARTLLARYEEERKTDALVMMGALDSLHRLFGADGRAVAAVRNAGLSALNAAGPVKRRLARHAMGGK